MFPLLVLGTIVVRVGIIKIRISTWGYPPQTQGCDDLQTERCLVNSSILIHLFVIFCWKYGGKKGGISWRENLQQNLAGHADSDYLLVLLMGGWTG